MHDDDLIATGMRLGVMVTSEQLVRDTAEKRVMNARRALLVAHREFRTAQSELDDAELALAEADQRLTRYTATRDAHAAATAPRARKRPKS